MKNSSTVEVKDKCKLGKLNGKSAACNQGDMNNLKISSIVNEEIDASEAYGADGTVNTLINGKRDVGLLLMNNLDADVRNNLSMHNINAIPIIRKDGTKSFIIYTNKANALKLRDHMNAHNGYAADTTPEEAVEVGKLLGYTDKSINNYIKSRFKKNPIDESVDPSDSEFSEMVLKLLEPLEIAVKNRDLPAFKIEMAKDIKAIREFGYRNGNMVLSDYVDEIQQKVNHLGMMSQQGWIHKYFKRDDNGGIARDVNGNFTDLDGESIDFYFDELKKELEAHITSGNSLNEAEIYSLDQIPFTAEINKLGGKIYSVGGAVRDKYLGKESKDLDIMITGVPMDTLEQILGKYGQVNLVGKSFGVLKFKPTGSTEDIDVAIPRTDTATGAGGHKGIETKSDHALPIEDDLRRRDLTINAIANDIEGNVIDPFGGVDDIRNKIIRMVDPSAFTEDPLRMLRAVQMASRFGFTIEPETMKAIQGSVSKIREIPSERILTEFDKIVQKGDHLIGANLLVETGIYKQLFGVNPMVDFNSKAELFRNAKTMGEFIYLLIGDTIDAPDEFYKTKLRGEINTYKEIKALKFAFDSEGNTVNIYKARSIAYNMYATYPESLKSNIIPKSIKMACDELLSGKYPKSNADLPVNGNDLMNLGFRGEQIKNKFKEILLKIYTDKLKNNREDILKYISSDNKPTPDGTDEPLNETIKGGEYVMYHGSKHKFDKFTDEFVGKENATDQEGPGIYFTESEEEAHMYGEYIYSVVLRPRKMTNAANKKVVSVSMMSSLIKMSPQWKEDAQNYDINPNRGLAKAISMMSEYADNEKDLYQQIWVDFFRHQPRLFIQGMSKLGFDGQLINKEYGGVRHIIAYNPAIITITNMVSKVPDATSENFNLQESLEQEGVGDKYAEKKFGIPDPDDEFEKDYKLHNLLMSEKPVAYVKNYDNVNNIRENVGIYKNPQSLSNFDQSTRAIADVYGNIYVAQKNGNFIHGEMAVALKFAVTDDSFYDNLDRFLLLNRVGNTNTFGLSDTTSSYVNADESDRRIVMLKIFKKLIQKNSQFRYYDRYFLDIKSDNKPINDTKITQEGVGDKYAANKFGIPDQDDEFEKEYKTHLQTQEEKPMAYVLDTKSDRIAIYKNPRSLANFDADVRAIGDPSGNIYVALQDKYFTHSRMAENIGLFTSGNEIYSTENLKKYTLMHRIGLTNGFGLGDAQYEIMNDEYENDGSLIANLRNFKKRNPQYNYYPDFYKFVKPNDKFVEESVNELSSVNPMSKKKLVKYSAVVLDDKSINKLRNAFADLIPDDYNQYRTNASGGTELICDHMTINFGEIDSFYEKYLGYTLRLKVESYAIDENVMAVGVSGFGSINDNRHITLAVNDNNGATAKMSNDLKKWIPYRKPLFLIGRVTEVPV